MHANGVAINFVRGDKIFQRGPNISRKSGPGVHFLRGSKYIVTDPSASGDHNSEPSTSTNPNWTISHKKGKQSMDTTNIPVDEEKGDEINPKLSVKPGRKKRVVSCKTY